jgi:hypothetical protein
LLELRYNDSNKAMIHTLPNGGLITVSDIEISPEIQLSRKFYSAGWVRALNDCKPLDRKSLAKFMRSPVTDDMYEMYMSGYNGAIEA